MITGRRWVQVTEMDPLNPYQRRRIVPAYGTNEGAHGMFMWNPVPDNFAIMRGSYPTTTPGGSPLAGPATPSALSWAAWLGGIAGLVAGGWWASQHL